jgi:hypothetical protein
MSEQMEASNHNSNSNSEVKLKLTIKTPKEKKDISIDASSTVKQVIYLNFLFEKFIRIFIS